MRDNDGRKLDHATLEALRVRAVEAIEAGASPDDVAETLGLHRGSVYRWWAAFRSGGKDALKARPVPGRPSTLADQQCARLYGIVVGKNPQQLSFRFGLWTRRMIATVIEREFGVTFDQSTVGRLLPRMGLSPQRPLRRAYEQNPDAVARWKNDTYQALREQAKAEGATIYFADEAGIRSDYHCATTWAPVGRTPVVHSTGARHSLNMLSAITSGGAMRFMVGEGTVNAAVFIEFRQRLLHDTGKPVYLVVDGHPAHRAKATSEFVASTGDRLKLVFLPGYSPELNPTNGFGRTSSTTPWAKPRSSTRTTSPASSPAHCTDSRSCPTPSGHSSKIPTSPTSLFESHYLRTA